MITLDSASGNLQIPKILDYQLLMENIQKILQIDDELFKYLYFSYIDENEQERIRLNPQIFDDFISQESPTLSIGFLENVDENIIDEFKEIIDLNKKRFKEIGYVISEEDLSLNNKMIINEDIEQEKENDNQISRDKNIILEKEGESEMQINENNKIILEEEKENDNQISSDKNIILEKERENEIQIDESNKIILEEEKENDIQISSDKNIILEKERENEIQIDESNKIILEKEKELENQNLDENKIILEKENINSDDIGINKKNSDNFNLLDSDNFKKINSNNFLIEQNNIIKKEDSISFSNVVSSDINLIKYNKNSSDNLISEEKKEIEDDEFNKNIENIISSNIENIKDDIIQSILLETSKIQQNSKMKRNNPKNNYVHKNYECINCNVFPIKGIRYHCIECMDFDICEKCEEKINHKHPLYKIKNDKSFKFKNEKIN